MITVLIVGDIRLYRDGLARLLDRDDRVKVVGTAEGLDHAMERIQQSQPRVVLLDMAMPDSLTAAKTILAECSDVQIVALAVPEVSRDVIACAEAGVAGYVPRQGSLEDLISTLESVDRGEFRCSPHIAASLLRRVAKLAAERGRGPESAHLTLRELEIVGLIDRGMSNKEIAGRLGIELATAKNHVHNILEKLHVHRRGEAAARVRHRLPRRSALRRTPVREG